MATVYTSYIIPFNFEFDHQNMVRSKINLGNEFSNQEDEQCFVEGLFVEE